MSAVREAVALLHLKLAVGRFARRLVDRQQRSFTIGFLSTSRRSVGAAPGSNSRLPVPNTTGSMKSRYSSIRPWACSVWARPALPWTCISPSYDVFAFAQSEGRLAVTRDPDYLQSERPQQAIGRSHAGHVQARRK
jgi:hypothetical protein